jgi:protein required for attachment to host cells
MEEPDWHHLEESRFVHTVAQAITRIALTEPELQVVVVMPPKALGDFRAGLSAAAKKHVVAEIHKDLAGFSARDIEQHLQAVAGPL